MAVIKLNPRFVVSANIATCRLLAICRELLNGKSAVSHVEPMLVLLIVGPLFCAVSFFVFLVTTVDRCAMALALFRGIWHQPCSSHTGTGLGSAIALTGYYRPAA
jgi:hypothetical protein